MFSDLGRFLRPPLLKLSPAQAGEPFPLDRAQIAPITAPPDPVAERMEAQAGSFDLVLPTQAERQQRADATRGAIECLQLALELQARGDATLLTPQQLDMIRSAFLRASPIERDAGDLQAMSRHLEQLALLETDAGLPRRRRGCRMLVLAGLRSLHAWQTVQGYDPAVRSEAASGRATSQADYRALAELHRYGACGPAEHAFAAALRRAWRDGTANVALTSGEPRIPPPPEAVERLAGTARRLRR